MDYGGYGEVNDVHAEQRPCRVHGVNIIGEMGSKRREFMGIM